MLGIDVARRALLGISTPPFRYFRRGEACAKDNNLYPVQGDDTIGKMLGQLLRLRSFAFLIVAKEHFFGLVLPHLASKSL